MPPAPRLRLRLPKGIITLKQTNASGADINFSASINSSNTIITINPTGNLSGTVYLAVSNGYYGANGKQGATANQTFTTPPTVASMALTSTGPYKAGDVITLAVTFSRPVTISTDQGHEAPPQIAIHVGSDTRGFSATASSVAKTTHAFTYQVEADRTDTNGISVSSRTLWLNGDTIADAASNAFVQGDNNLPNNLSGNQSGHEVDTTKPTLSSFAFTSTGPYETGEVITLQATFSESVTIATGTAASIPLTIGSNTRNATAASTTTASTTHNFTYTVSGTDVDSDGIAVASSGRYKQPGPNKRCRR